MRTEGKKTGKKEIKEMKADLAWESNCQLRRCKEGRETLEGIGVCTPSGGSCKRLDKSVTKIQRRQP